MTKRTSARPPRPSNTTETRGRKREGQRPEVQGEPIGLMAANIERLMIQAGLTPADIAERLWPRVSADTVRKWIQGYSAPHVNRWPEIAHILGCQFANDLLPKIPAKIKAQ